MDAEPKDTQTRALSGDKKASGKGCGCVVFLLLFLLGAVLLGFWAFDDYRIFNEYVHATCTVTGKRVVEHSDSDGDNTYHPEVDFTFEANGQTISATGYDGWSGSSSGREGKERAIAPYQIGGTYDCWYDPQNPHRAVLVRRISWLYLIPFVLMAIGAFGGVMMLRKPSGPSREAELYQKQLKIEDEDALLETGPVGSGSQGQTLAVRLGRHGSDFGKAIGLLVAGIFWNGIVGVFMYVGLSGGFGGASWFALIFLSVFGLVGLLILVGFVQTLLVALGVGETIVEISADRLAPGQPFEVLVIQAGRMRLNELTLRLVCEEKATYRQGTNTNTATEKVLDEVLVSAKDAEIEHGRPLQVRGKGRIPFDAMHGFLLGNNKLLWRIEVKGDVRRWPDFSREFAIEVRPEAPVRAEGGEA